MASQNASSDDDAQKRNTDCVYFLASPLTCKKGADCEYRHSESARINPRDCHFWLSGNCLNPNCSFRHPPLDGRPATSFAHEVLSAPPVPPSKIIPCYFFSQGYCAKGEKCYFMHEPQTAPVLVAASKRQLKPVIKSSESTDNQTFVSKGNGACVQKLFPESSQGIEIPVCIKASAEHENGFIDRKQIQSTQEVNARQKHAMKIRAAEGSSSSEFAKPSDHPKLHVEDYAKPSDHQKLHVEDYLKQVPTREEKTLYVQISNERVMQVHTVDEKTKQFPLQVHAPDDRMQQVHSGEERIQNGLESEDWLEESSPGFDVLVDGGPGHLVYLDEIDYIHQHDILMESGSRSRGRFMSSDDLGESGYNNPSIYNQSGYYDTPGQYDLDQYDPYEQQHGYENPYNHLTRQPPALYYENGRPARDRHRTVPKGDIQHGLGTDDLRNQITKRRRLNDRIRPHAGDDQHHHVRWRGIPAYDYQHGLINQDSHARWQEMLMCHHAPTQEGGKQNQRRLYTRGESGTKKRTYEDNLISESGGNQEWVSIRSLQNKHNLGDRKRTKARERDHRHVASETAEIRGHAALNNRKNEIRKDDVDFAGPKSLAQIKAEKCKVSGHENGNRKDMFNDNRTLLSMPPGNVISQRQVSPVKIYISSEPSAPLRMAAFVGEAKKASCLKAIATDELIKDIDFEGPKPLSAILEAKCKADLKGGQKLREIDEGLRKMDVRIDSSLYADPGSLCRRGSESLELRQSHNAVQLEQNGVGMQHSLTQQQYPDTLGEMESWKDDHMESEKRSESRTDMHDSRSGEDARTAPGFCADMEVEPGAGDNTVENEDFGLDADDDDDDFAKKLGGFFP